MKKMALTQKINGVCELLYESKALTRETPAHVLAALTLCSVPEFVDTLN